MELKEAILQVHPVSDKAIAALMAYAEPFEAEKGNSIIKQGVLTREVYIVLDGILSCHTLVDGIEHTRWFATPGDWVTSMCSFYMGLPASSSVTALTPVSGYSLKAEDAKLLMTTDPEWTMWVMKYCIEGLFVLERRQTTITYGDALSRYLNFLRSRSAVTFNSIPLQHIASYLGMTPQTLSRVRRKVALDPGLYSGKEFPETDL